MFHKKQKSRVKCTHLVTDDGLYDRKVSYKLKIVLILYLYLDYFLNSWLQYYQTLHCHFYVDLYRYYYVDDAKTSNLWYSLFPCVPVSSVIKI